MSELATAPARPASEPADASRHIGWVRAVWRSRNGRIGMVLVAITVVGAICGLLGVSPYGPNDQNPAAVLKGVSFAHLFGTDQFGRDVFSGTLQGLGVSLEIAVLSVAIAGVIGTLGGIVAGFLGKWISTVIMRLTDMMFAIPAILFALAIVTALGSSILDSAIAIGVGWIPIFVRVVRSPVLALREADFVRAGRVLGYSRRRLLFRHILPNIAGVIAVQTSLALAWAILAEAGLSYLGLGPPPPLESLGEMVSQSSSLAGTAWWTLAGPSLVIIFTVIGFNFLGDGLRDAADPPIAHEGEVAVQVIGMISGTSFDAIEAVAADIELDGTEVVVTLLEHVSAPYPTALHDAIAAVLPPQSTTIDEVCRLDTLIGQTFAEIAADLGQRHFAGATDVVCSHGQTVFHWVEGGDALGTLQLGQGAWIAERTGATVVADVRSRDIAAGGHGAPLASLVDVLLLGRNPPSVRGALNLGGIANMTVVGPNREPLAFDIGPANALIDAAVGWLTDGAELFDEGGRRARRGTVDQTLLAELLTDPYYDVPAPKSTGKEYFHLNYLRDRLGSRFIAPDDLVATLTALTAETVARAVRALDVREVFASGGGTRNVTLWEELATRTPGVTWSLIDQFGVPEAAKEAMLFALIGFLSVQGLEGTIASCTGAAHATVLGAITPGRYAVTALDARQAPTSMRVASRSSTEAP